MKTFFGLIFVALAVLILPACNTSEGVIDGRPRLISEVTLPPVTLAPTRALSPTAIASPMPQETEEIAASPAMTSTAVPGITVTPTLPPSKTPSITPSVTATAADTATPAPTREIRITPEPTVLVPTMVFMLPPTQAVVVAANPTLALPAGDVSLPLPGVPDQPAASCSTPWFFTYPVLPDCPPSAAVESPAAYQTFEYGYMIWIGNQSAIYVIYISADMPRWQVFPDNWVEGMPDSDPSLDALAPPYAEWQPRRGFGLVWRTEPGVMSRIGWAESPYEQGYTAVLQTRTDGTIFIREPNRRVFALSPDGNWQLYG